MKDSRPKVVITDFDFGDIEIERAILEKVGARVIGLQAKSEADLFDEARECVAIMNQYARIGSATIARMERCKVIARYGVGVISSMSKPPPAKAYWSPTCVTIALKRWLTMPSPYG